jgi:hypothetical protein
MRIAPWIVLAGCSGTSPNATLADLPRLSLVVQEWAPGDTTSAHGFVDMSYDIAAFKAAHGGACAILDDSFHATLDGAPLDTDPGATGDDLVPCYPPSLGFEAQFAGPTTFVASDDSLEVTAVFGADAFAPHVPMLRSPATWQFAPGEMVRIGWSVPEDLTVVGSEPFQVMFNTLMTEDNNAFDLDPTASGDEIQFTVPNPPLRTGPGFIVFRFGYSGGDAVTCTNAVSCTFSAERGYVHSVVIGN